MDKKFVKEFLKGSAAASIGSISSIVFHFVSIMLLTRYLTKEEFGVFALVIVIVNFLNIISGLGLGQSLVKFISSIDDQERKSTLIPSLFVRVVAIVIISLLLIVFSKPFLSLFSFTAADFTYVIIILFAISSFRDLFYPLLQGLKLFKKYASIQIVTSVLRVVFLLMLIMLNNLSIKNILYIEICVASCAVMLQLLAIRHKGILLWAVNIKTISRILSFSIPLYFTSILSFIYNRVNIFIIGAYLSPVSVASYDVASKIPLAIKKVFQSFIIVYFPNLSKLFSKGDKKSAISLINKSLISVSTAINLLVLISFLFNKEIILLVFSDKYLDASLAFSLLMVVFYFQAMSNIMGYSLVSAGFPYITLRVNIISSALSLIGALIMVPYRGFIGAVYSLLLAGMSSLLLHYSYLIKFEMKLEMSNVVKPALMTIVLLFFYYQFAQDNIFYKGIVLIIYLIAVYFFIPEARELFAQIEKHLFKIKSEKKIA